MGHSLWQCDTDDSQVSELQHGLIQSQHWRSSRATQVSALLAIPAVLPLVGVQEKRATHVRRPQGRQARLR